MKVTLNWLKQYVDFNWSPEELAERLTMLGLEVEGVQKLGGEFDGIVVAQVITKDKHPNADKLTLCRVNDGKGERQIVCGATNFKPGDKVPLILPGATLPAQPGAEPFTIKVGKIRGVESYGMMCSPKELGLSDDAQGLLILREDARMGQPFAEYLGRASGDVVYDLEVTPNRPDLNSVIGIAREIAAVTGNALQLPTIEPHATPHTEHAYDLVAVRIADPDLCPRYTARVVRGVKIGPSPDWLRSMLEKVGIRSISNVVDVTNYVMMEIGQPLHAFDYRLIAKAADGKPTIVIRRAQPGELFLTLDGQKRTMTGDMLLIADEHKGIALAGVMGGLNSEINDQTVDVLIESAYFKPQNIRMTSKALGLRTDASYRFERGADIDINDWASRRCAQLILETAGGRLAEDLVDAYPQPFTPKQITLRHHKVNELLGIQLQPEEIEYHLGQLGLKMVNRQPQPVGTPVASEPVTFQIPTWRVDLKRETDLIEEVERLYGVEKVPPTPPRGAIGSNPFDAVHDQIAEARRILAGLGLNEAQGQTLISDAAAKLAAPAESVVLLANPLSSDMNALRPTLLPGLLDSLRHNLAHQNEDVALFEVGRVFSQANGGTREERRVAIGLTGQRSAPFWSGSDRGATFEMHDLKGLLEEFLEQFGLRGVVYTKRADTTALFVESAVISLGGKVPLGEMGHLVATVAKRYDLRGGVFLAEMSLDQLIARRNVAKSFKPLPQFPSVRRDVAMIVPESVTHETVLQTVRQAKPANLESVELFDVFRGKNVPAGHKSVAYAFTYRHAQRTLTDAEVNTAQDKLVERLKQGLQAVIRER
jgi:phenylalanyl-tRNA synthetase beta chain